MEKSVPRDIVQNNRDLIVKESGKANISVILHEVELKMAE